MELFKAERDKLVPKTRKTAVNEQEFYLALRDIVEIAQEAENIFKSSQIEQKRRLLNLVFANLQIKDKKLIFDYTKPFGDFSKGFSYKLWGRPQISFPTLINDLRTVFSLKIFIPAPVQYYAGSLSS